MTLIVVMCDMDFPNELHKACRIIMPKLSQNICIFGQVHKTMFMVMWKGGGYHTY